MVDAVVVTYNSAPFVGQGLRSLLDQDGIGQVIVVDNASTDETVDEVSAVALESGGRIRLHRSPVNMGFGAATNFGVTLSRAPLLLLVNPDVILAGEATVSRSVASLMSDPEAAVLGCALYTAEGGFDHAAKRSEPSIRSALLHFSSGLLPGRLKPRSNYRAEFLGECGQGRVDSINGAFMLMRRATFCDVGGFDERFFMYAEDLDLCRRVRNEIGAIRFDGTIVATHLKGACDGGRRSPATEYHFWHSMAIYVRKYGAGSRLRSLMLARSLELYAIARRSWASWSIPRRE